MRTRREFLTTAGRLGLAAGIGAAVSRSRDWLFHCHKPLHMMGGMVSVVKVG